MDDSLEIKHVIGMSISEVEETSISPDRYIRRIRVRTALGHQFTLVLCSENRLALTVEQDERREVRLMSDPKLRKSLPPESL